MNRKFPLFIETSQGIEPQIKVCLYRVIGVCGFIAFGYLSVYNYFFTKPDATTDNTILISDNLISLNVNRNELRQSRSFLEIRAKDNEFIFRSKLPYPKYYIVDPIEKISSGQPIEIRVRQEDWKKVTKNRELKIIDICSLSSEDEDYMTLPQYNESHKKNRFIGMIICPILFLSSLYILFKGLA